MDEIVKAALRKWPNVPHCFGWLALDARGDWYLRDERTQHAGRFPQLKGSRIDHRRLKEFIVRNYAGDAQGCWFFQNGPQRVYVQLETAPWVWRLTWQHSELTVTSHTGRAATVRSSWLDDEGRLYLDTDIGFGSVHSQDMIDAALAIERGLWAPLPLVWAAAPARFGYVRDPQPAAAP